MAPIFFPSFLCLSGCQGQNPKDFDFCLESAHSPKLSSVPTLGAFLLVPQSECVQEELCSMVCQASVCRLTGECPGHCLPEYMVGECRVAGLLAQDPWRVPDRSRVCPCTVRHFPPYPAVKARALGSASARDSRTPPGCHSLEKKSQQSLPPAHALPRTLPQHPDCPGQSSSCPCSSPFHFMRRHTRHLSRIAQPDGPVTWGFGASSRLGSPWKASPPCTPILAAQKLFYREDGSSWGAEGRGEGAYSFITDTSQRRSRFQRKFIVFERSEGDFTRV